MRYETLCSCYSSVESAAKRLEKTYYMAELLRKTHESDIRPVVQLLQGTVFPNWDPRKIGVAARLVLRAISKMTGESTAALERRWAKTGDISIVAKEAIGKKKQATLLKADLTVEKVFGSIARLALLEGAGTVGRKLSIIADLLSNAKPDEIVYIVRTLLDDLRIGVAEGTLRDAIIWAFFPHFEGIYAVPKDAEKAEKKGSVPKALKTLKIKKIRDFEQARLSQYESISSDDEKLLREAYNRLTEIVQESLDVKNDFAEVALIARTGGMARLRKISLRPLRPVKVMLAQKVASVKEGLERVGVPCQAEFKYDGFRMQIHREDDRVRIFTRRLEEVTAQFPEVVEAVRRQIRSRSFILDAEAVGLDASSGRYMPFQHVSQRIRRKYSIEELAKKLPVEVNVFDVIYYNGRSMLKYPLKQRRSLVEKIIREQPKRLVIAKKCVSSKAADIEKFYKSALEIGNEGIMLKKLSAPYKPGARVGFMVKLKPVMETLDLAIVSAEWGEGKRAKWLSSFTLACVDANGELLEIGKVGTGVKEKEQKAYSKEAEGKEAEGVKGRGAGTDKAVTFGQLTELLKPLIVAEKGREVKVRPEVVVEVNYEEIQKSPSYGSGYALRFPRIVALRPDRVLDDVSTLEFVERLFRGQRGKK